MTLELFQGNRYQGRYFHNEKASTNPPGLGDINIRLFLMGVGMLSVSQHSEITQLDRSAGKQSACWEQTVELR